MNGLVRVSVRKRKSEMEVKCETVVATLSRVMACRACVVGQKPMPTHFTAQVQVGQ